MTELVWDGYLQYLKSRVFTLALACGLALVVLSLLFGGMTFAEGPRTLFHFGLTFAHLFGIFVGIFLGSKDIRSLEVSGCIYMYLARPIGRRNFLISRMISVYTTVATGIAILGLVICCLLPSNFMGHVSLIVWGILLEVGIAVSLSYLFALLVEPMLAASLALAVVYVGQSLPDLNFFAQKTESIVFQVSSRALSIVVPHFYRLNWRDFDSLNTLLVDWQKILLGTVYSIGWIAFCGWLATLVFTKIDIGDKS